MRMKYLGSLFCVAFFFCVVQAGTYEEKVEKTFSMRKGGELVLENKNGRVIITSWDRDEIKVEAVKTVKAGSRRHAEEILQEVRIDFTYDSDDAFLGVNTRIPKYRSGFWENLFGDGVSVSVSYHVTVPNQLDLDIESVNGKIDVSDVAGKLRFKTTNGTIKVRDAGGKVDAVTTNGGIDVELREVERNEDMVFSTTNGGITVYFPKDFDAEIEARTTNGSIRTDFPIRVVGDINRRRLQGKINEGGGRIKLNTTNGSIRILED